MIGSAIEAVEWCAAERRDGNRIANTRDLQVIVG
jgi:hypothetical protein